MQSAALGRQVRLPADLFEQGRPTASPSLATCMDTLGWVRCTASAAREKPAMPDHGLENLQLAQSNAPGEFIHSRTGMTSP
jgi:hypothetical protein